MGYIVYLIGIQIYPMSRSAQWSFGIYGNCEKEGELHNKFLRAHDKHAQERNYPTR
jgi:hypothetical protein